MIKHWFLKEVRDAVIKDQEDTEKALEGDPSVPLISAKTHGGGESG